MPRSVQAYIDIGERYGTPLVLQEAREAYARWGEAEDLALLALWGFGKKRRERLAALIEKLSARHTIYADQVGEKLAALPASAEVLKSLRIWVQRGLSILLDRIEEDADIEKRVRALGSRIPDRPGRLLAYASPLLEILRKERQNLDEEAATEEYFSEGAKLIPKLQLATAQKSLRKQAKEVGTSELDELDGRVYVELANLYKNARQALKSEGKEERARQYAFQYLTSSGAPGEDAEEPEPPTPATPTAPEAKG